MDSNKHSAQFERLEVVETGRRRRWSEDEKLKIVLESLQAPRAVSSTARGYGISRSPRAGSRFPTMQFGCFCAAKGRPFSTAAIVATDKDDECVRWHE